MEPTLKDVKASFEETGEVLPMYMGVILVGRA